LNKHYNISLVKSTVDKSLILFEMNLFQGIGKLLFEFNLKSTSLIEASNSLIISDYE
jgi:hypothetical protein